MTFDILLKDYQPRPELVTETHLVNKPMFPVIDGHNHIGLPFGHPWEDRPVKELLDLMDEAGVEVMVDLDGGFGEQYLIKHLIILKKPPRNGFMCSAELICSSLQKRAIALATGQPLSSASSAAGVPRGTEEGMEILWPAGQGPYGQADSCG